MAEMLAIEQLVRNYVSAQLENQAAGQRFMDHVLPLVDIGYAEDLYPQLAVEWIVLKATSISPADYIRVG